MAHYSLWISGANGKQPAEALSDVGLSSLIDDRDLTPSCVSPPSGTPCGGPGLLVQWLDVNSDEPPTLGLRPDVQTWKRVRETPLWYGVEPARPVRPIDLLRKSEQPGVPRYRGRTVGLGEEDALTWWEIPNQLDLPKTFVLDADDHWVPAVSAAHQSLWDQMQGAYRAARFEWLQILRAKWLTLPEAERADMTAPALAPAADEWHDGQAADHVIWAISLNYRLFRFVASEMRLMSERRTWPALQATTDLEALSVLQAQAKNWDAHRERTQGGPSINGGAPA